MGEEERMKRSMMNGNNNNDDNKFKTTSPPTYGDDGIREVPMDREIPIQRPRGVGDNNRARNNNNNNHYNREHEEEDEVASETASPNASPARQMAAKRNDYVDDEPPTGKSALSVSVSVKETATTKIGTQARRLVSPSPLHESTSETIFDNLD